MIRFTLFIAIFFYAGTTCFGQDTIRIEPSQHYTRQKSPDRGKLFAARVKFAREDIVFSATHRRIEYCYYDDNKRTCHGTAYELTSDSTLAIDGTIWHYKKRSDQYFVDRYFNGTYESGFAKSLIPLEATGLFTTTTADKIDTLWTTDYSTDNPARLYDHPSWAFHQTKVNGKIYASNEVDEPPVLLNGDSMTTISLTLNRSNGCYSEPYNFVKALKFVVTQEGRIVNIEQSIGYINLNNCPYYVMDLMQQLLQSGPLRPAKINGQNVSVQWSLKVEMNDEP